MSYTAYDFTGLDLDLNALDATLGLASAAGDPSAAHPLQALPTYDVQGSNIHPHNPPHAEPFGTGGSTSEFDD